MAATALLLTGGTTNAQHAVGSLPPSHSVLLTRAQVAQYAKNNGFHGYGLVMAIAISDAESSFYVDAVGQNAPPSVTNDLGLWQINDYYHSNAIGHASGSELYDVDKLYKVSVYGVDTVANYNAVAADAISTHGTIWDQWATYGGYNGVIKGNGIYQNKLVTARSAAALIDSTVLRSASGDTVKVNSSVGVKVRLTAGGAEVVGSPKANGSTGVLITGGGPTLAYLSSANRYYIWWQVDWGGGVQGWSAEDFLERTGGGGGAPAAPVATAATNVTSSSFQENWNASSGATGYRMDVALDSGFTNYVYNNYDVGNFTGITVTPLSAGTTYYYRVRAYNGSGTSGNSGTINVTTTGNAPAAPVATAATNVTSSSFQENWNASSGATGYYMDVSTSSTFSNFVFNNYDVGNFTGITVTPLSAGTTYYYRIRAYNGSGTSGNSNTITVTTSGSAPAAPVATAATSVTSSSFLANWGAVSGATGYYMDVSTSSTFGSYVFNNYDVGNYTGITVTPLSAGTTYYYRIRAYNGSGTSGNSNTITVTTSGSTKIISLSGNLAFGNVAVGSSAQSTLTITNTGNAVLSISGITYPTGFSGNWAGQIGIGQSQNIAVTFAPTAATSYGGTVTATSDATSGTNTIQCSGTGISAATRIIGLTGNLAFGSVAVGSSAQSTLTIANTGNTVLSVSGITYPSGFSGNWAGQIGVGQSQNVTVTFSPSAATSYGGTVTVTSDKTSGTNTATASGTGTVTATRIIGLTGNLAFGNVAVGSSAQSTLTITNTGNTVLSVGGITYPSGFSGNWAGQIGVGQSQNVTVTFSPTTVSSYGGTVTVASDATSGTNTIQSSGTGTSTAAQVNLTPYKPSGWSDKIVVTRATGATFTSAVDAANLSTADTLYVDWAAVNNGTQDITNTYHTEIYVDNVLKVTFSTTSLPAGYINWASDYSIGSLSAGTHTIKVKADSANEVLETNESDNEYVKTITVNAVLSTNANLSNLAISTGSLNPAFASATTSYAATVPNATAALTITPTVADTTAAVKVNGVAVSSGTASAAVSLNIGSNTITTVVTAQDGTTTKTYTLAVTRDTYYATWSATHSVTGTGSGLTEDFDHDGLINVLEMAFGTDPTVTNSGVITLNGATIAQRGIPTVWMQNNANGVDYRALFGRRTDYVAAGLTYTVQFSADLVTWQNSTDTPTRMAGDSEIDAVTVPYPYFVNGRKARFFRVQVSSQ